MRSLRNRLVTWYVTVGAILVLCIGFLGAIATVEAVSFEARQSLAQAAVQAPALVETFRKTHGGLAGVNDFLGRQFAPRGVQARVVDEAVMPSPRDMPLKLGPAPGRFFAYGRAPDRMHFPLFAGLFAMAIKPVTASFSGGNIVLFVDPRRFSNLFEVWGVFVFLLAVVVLIASWRIAVTVASNTLEPLLRTTKALDRFGSGDFTPESVNTNDRSELGELAHAYNRAVAQITRAFDERSKAEAEMRQFVADAGHQLRTPLTVIMGYLSGMAHRAQPLAQAQSYATMLAQSRRMKSLIDDLITLARLEHPTASATQRVDLNDVCAQIHESFSAGQRLRINVRLPGEPAFVDANEIDIAGALCALVDNALKYAPDNPVEVTVANDTAHWVISVADRGPGMTGADLGYACDRFYRGSAAEGIEGTGLGLPIVRKSIERAGGTLLLCNRAAGGLLCTIRLPAVKLPAIAARAR